ncbi:HRDC domain-containing protein, partial [Nonomuraea sp. NPDC059022]|uniref:HRDC domain-containing protein n=1 Tax=Nonomuraea sp. NPDC059022 TaxID=3346705 RepID=UPI00369FAE39
PRARRAVSGGVPRPAAHSRRPGRGGAAPGPPPPPRPSRFLDGLTGRPATTARAAAAPAHSRERRQVAAPVSCRICARNLATAAEQKLGRCSSCPADYDEALLESLKSWRTTTAKEAKIPPYVVFTDVTLQAIAERVPRTDSELLSIAGIGKVKLDKYGEAVLGLCRGA